MQAVVKLQWQIIRHLWMPERGLIMALTETQNLLLDCLKHFGVSKGKAMVVFLLLKKENQQMDMIEYLLSKEKVTDEEALDMARRLAAK